MSGHRWATILGADQKDTRFPLVCRNCMCRDDSVWADRTCDNAAVQGDAGTDEERGGDHG